LPILIMKMNDRKIILASKSPRRKYLMEQAGFSVEVRTFDVEEIYPDDLKLREVPEYLAKLKSVPAKVALQEGELLLAADTIVLFENEILGKPKDRDQAKDFILRMSDKSHEVITGVSIQSTAKQNSFSVTSKVIFSTLTEDEVDYYIDNFKPYDKAGAYGIQDWIGWTKIKSIVGSYSNIMGLPMREVYEAIKNFDHHSPSK